MIMIMMTAATEEDREAVTLEATYSSGRVWFESSLVHSLSQMRLFAFFLNPSARILPHSSHDCFLPNPSQIIIHLYSSTQRYAI
jgi:hypothetical protein